jgi:PilZ domain
MIERRKFGRRTVLKPALCIASDGGLTECTVVDQSDGGARVQLKSGEPSLEFTLFIPEDDFAVRCIIVHRREGQIGVKYLRLPTRITRALRMDALLRDACSARATKISR